MALSPGLARRMKLLIHTRFHPNVGGIETVAALLVREWARAGESVTVVTDIAHPGDTKAEFAFPVWRQPSPGEWVRLLRSHDVVIHFNVSLRAVWPLLLVRRPFVAVHHGFYIVDRSGRRDWKEKLKLWIARRATRNVAVSEAIARAIGIRAAIIPNPYDPAVFFSTPQLMRSRDLIFVGRLVSDKGVDGLLRALALVRDRDLRPGLTIVGDGPERSLLEKLVEELGLNDQVRFTGSKSPRDIADLFRQHTILVVPSLWEEPFGVVALEGIASGCAVIASKGGGLPEAVGPCGVTFPNGNVAALAGEIEHLLTESGRIAELLANAKAHLAKHDPSRVAEQYLQVIGEAACLK
jgi:glycogen(starch) synthase